MSYLLSLYLGKFYFVFFTRSRARAGLCRFFLGSKNQQAVFATKCLLFQSRFSNIVTTFFNCKATNLIFVLIWFNFHFLLVNKPTGTFNLCFNVKYIPTCLIWNDLFRPIHRLKQSIDPIW
jgi:hypothetical protein